MSRTRRPLSILRTTLALGLFLPLASVGRGARAAEPAATPPPLLSAELAGAWAGTAEHDGETTPFAIELEPDADGKLLLKATVPAAHFLHAPFGKVAPKIEEGKIKLGPFAFDYDAQAKTLTGAVPAELAPVYALPLRLRRVERVETPARPEPGGALAEPAWTFDAKAPLWAGATVAGGMVYAGGEDGQLHAVDARSGEKRWAFQAGGKLRTRATAADGALYFQADDGLLYKLDAASGREAWRVKILDKPVERLPFDNPKSRFDRFGSDVTAAGGRLYVGTHEGKLLALEAATGARAWELATGDSVLAAPSLAEGRLYFGSYDKHVYAVDAASGRLLWKRDTQGAVVSTPAVAGDLVVVGNRCYDLLGIRSATGEIAWKRYLWFSWIESSAVVRDGVAYVGSSDAASVGAFDAQTGQPRWQADVFGWAWGQPAVTDDRVYAATSSQAGYPAGHKAGVMALDRASGRVAWRYEAKPAEKGAFGFPGSPALGAGFVYVTGLDGRIYAFKS
jgi:outer membrane protein assembly factor BamB